MTTYYLFWDNDGGLLGDVQTIQELTDILVLDSGRLLDTCCRLGNGFDVVAVNVELVLLGLGDLDGDARGHGHLAEELLTQEVANLQKGTALNNCAVDGEMGIGRAELVSEAKCDTLGHVGAHGADGGLVTGAAHPLLDENRLLGSAFHFHLQVAEILHQSATGAGDCDLTGLDGASDTIVNGNLLGVVENFHFNPRSGL